MVDGLLEREEHHERRTIGTNEWVNPVRYPRRSVHAEQGTVLIEVGDQLPGFQPLARVGDVVLGTNGDQRAIRQGCDRSEHLAAEGNRLTIAGSFTSSL